MKDISIVNLKKKQIEDKWNIVDLWGQNWLLSYVFLDG